MIATLGAPCGIGRRELATRDERYAHRREVARPNAVDARVHVLVFLRLISVDLDGLAPSVASERAQSPTSRRCEHPARRQARPAPPRRVAACATRRSRSASGSTENVSRLSTEKPGSTDRRLNRLRAKRPAPASSIIDSATCANHERAADPGLPATSNDAAGLVLQMPSRRPGASPRARDRCQRRAPSPGPAAA